MGTLYGAYLLITLSSLYVVIYVSISNDKNAKYVGYKVFLVVLLFWFFQNTFRHTWSPEAIARKKFDIVLDKWRDGDKTGAMSELDTLSEYRPWKISESDDYED